MKRVILKEIAEEPRDLKYEFFRALKTFCLILTIFCIGFILKNNYNKLFENGRYMRFYPANTLFYQDGVDLKEKKINIDCEDKFASYGIFENDHGKGKFLAVCAMPDKEDTPIIENKKYSTLSKGGYTFISDSDEELKNLLARIQTKNYSFLKNKNVKKIVKNFDETRTGTIVATNVKYSGLPVNNEVMRLYNKIFNVAAVQIFERPDRINFSGEVTFQNKIADAAINFQKMSARKSIKIEHFDNDNPTLIIGVKDFDLWSRAFIKIAKAMPDNRYNATFKLIQAVFNSDIEEDIVKKLNGSAVFYLYSDKKTLHPMLLLETKKDLAAQGKKYLNFLQLSNNSKLSEKEVNNKTFNILSSGFYPYNLSFGSIGESMFILGHQNIIEKYLQANSINFTEKNCDFYLYTDIKNFKTSAKKPQKDEFLNKYKSIETELYLSPSINFQGVLYKQ